MPACLVSLCGYPNIDVTSLLTIVGRHQNCDAKIGSPRVSRRHCCLALDGETLVVRDLSSSNGTWINGRRIEDGLLRHGDELAIAHLRYRFEIRSDPGDTRPPTPRPVMTASSPCEPAPPTDLYDRVDNGKPA